MKSATAVRSSLLSIIIALALAGCSDSDDSDLSQKDIQYLSHLDQSRFYQRQGELKASTLEARSAIELQPGQIEPYFLIIDNLLTAGDAVNAERQIKRLLDQVSGDEHGAAIRNRANLILAEALMKQAKYDRALTVLDQMSAPSDDISSQATLLKGQIHLAAGDSKSAHEAFLNARKSAPESVDALIGLSKVALANDDEPATGEWLAKAEEINPDHPELWLWKAQRAHLQEQWETAEESYIRALEDIGQYDVMTARKYGTISALISVLRAQSKFSEAFVYEEILAKSPPGKIRSNLIAAEEALKSNELAKAERYLNEVLAQAPEHEQTNLMLGLVRFRQGRPEDAQALLQPIASKGESDIASKMLAATMLQMGDAQGAQSTLADLKGGDSDPEILTLVAIASLESGNHSTGEALMEKALGLKPENHELRLRYAGYLSQRGEHDRAVDQVNQVRELAPTLNQARQVLIQVQVRSGDMDAASASAEKWVKEENANPLAWITLGNLQLTQGQSEQAREHFLTAQRKSPESVEPEIALGQLALVQNDRSEARTHFEKAVELNPENGQALQGLLSVQKQEQTTQFLGSVLNAHPEAVRPRLILLRLALIDGDTETADELTAALMERSAESVAAPHEHLVADLYGSTIAQLRADDQAESAAAVLTRALTLFPDNEQINLEAVRQNADKGELETALRLLETVKQQNPQSATPHVVEAELLEQNADYAQAALQYRKALDKKSSPESITGYVRNLQRSGKTQEALTFLQSELEASPANLQLRLNLALLQQSTGDTKSAQANYERLLAAMPDNTVVLNNLAWLYHKNDDPRAVKLAERAYELSPDNAAIADTYGWIMLKTGAHQESVPVLEKAHELQPDSEEIARHLAEAYRVVGMKSAAQRILEKFGDQG